MSAVDASAVLAVLFEEPDADAFQTALSLGSQWHMSAVNYWELLVGARRHLGAEGVEIAERMLRENAVAIVPADANLAREAAEAFRRFKSRANGRLNLGDSFAYALAKRESGALLFKGDDFARTDLVNVLGSPPA